MTYEERVFRARRRVEAVIAATLAAIDETEARLAAGGSPNADPIAEAWPTIRAALISYVTAARGRARAERLTTPKPAPQVADAFPVGRGQGGPEILEG